jgi:hypothetical protein
VRGITLKWPEPKLAFDLGQVNPLKIKLGVAITIKISVAFNWFGTRMLTKTPMKETEITNTLPQT